METRMPDKVKPKLPPHLREGSITSWRSVLAYFLIFLLPSNPVAAETVDKVLATPIPTVNGWNARDATVIADYYPTPLAACTAQLHFYWPGVDVRAVFINQNQYNCERLTSYSGWISGGATAYYYAYCPKPYYFIGGYYVWQNCSSFPAGAECSTTCTPSANLKVCPTPSLRPDIPYTPDPNGVTCSRPDACSTHAHGTPCVCDDGYKFNAAGTSCILEQYTISLSGLGGVVMPTRTRAAYAQVNTSTGSPKSGIPVNLALTVIEEPDGYNHAVGQHTAPHKATLLLLAGATGADGRQPFEFVAPVAGGVHTITASCDKCANQATDTIRVPGCPVPELTEIKKLSELAGETQEQTQLTQKLEDGMDGYSLLSKATQAAEQCLAGRIGAVVGNAATSGYKVTSTIRTFAYQKHLREVWDKFWDLRGGSRMIRLSSNVVKL